MNRARLQSSFQPSMLRHKGDLSPIRPRQKMPTIYRHRRQRQQPKSGPEWPKDNSFLRKRIDKTVLLQREEMVMKTGRTSIDNPEWMSGNFNNYRRNSYSIPQRYNHKEERFFDVMNNPKRVFYGRNEDNYFVQMQEENPQKPAATDLSTLRKTLQYSQLLHGNVSDKVGSTNERDHSIPRPQLKVGKSSFIDTYSPF